MKILFTTSDLYFSKLVMDNTGEPASHVAIELDCGIVIHSNWLGVHMESSVDFRKKVKVVAALYPKKSISDKEILHTYVKYQHSYYDVGAFFFLGFSLYLRSAFNIPLPKSNLWQSTGLFLCTEWGAKAIDEKVDSMITPWKLYLKHKDSGEWLDAT